MFGESYVTAGAVHHPNGSVLLSVYFVQTGHVVAATPYVVVARGVFMAVLSRNYRI